MIGRLSMRDYFWPVFWLIVGLIIFAAAMAFAFPVKANAWPSYPGCTYEQPYPGLPQRICTGYGQSCASWVCDSPPGTPGEWGTDGIYTPKVG